VLPITPFPNGVSEDSHPPTKHRVKLLLERGWTVTEIARHLGVSKATVCFHKRTLGIGRDSRFSRRYDWTEIRRHYEAGHSMRECQALFGFSGAAWSQAVRRGDIEPRPRAVPPDNLFCIGDKRNRFHLKRRLLRDGLKEARCEGCGLTHWRGAVLSLELHHKNGDGRDNRLENLEFLCPNCHSQTDNWGGKGKVRAA
jgi:Homeodomain-like domain/HNH endonuclease